ncbi:MAG: nucleotidyltransferase domain-containing protein [Acidobacteriota bacterium]
MNIKKGDNNFVKIKKLINKVIPYRKKTILFGSRTGSDYNSASDYDILVIVNKSGIKRRDLLEFQIKIKRSCAKKGIDIDLIVRDLEYSNEIKDFPGNIINSALNTGVQI